MAISKNNKMLQFVRFRLRVTLQDGRTFVGQMLAFDRYMNLVLSDCEEFRRVPASKAGNNPANVAPRKTLKTNAGSKVNASANGSFVEQKRNLGLIVLRGSTIISLSVEGGPPPSEFNRARMAASAQMSVPGGAGVIGGPGLGRAAGRGMPVALPGQAMGMGPVPGLMGPVAGIGMGAGVPGGVAAAPPVVYHHPNMQPGVVPPPMPPMPVPGFNGGRPPMPPGFRPPPPPGSAPGFGMGRGH